MTNKQASNNQDRSYLAGLRVLEIGDEKLEYCGKTLAGLGADVVKVEPPEGEVTRRYGPFYHDEPNIERSLFFWHYNAGKRSIALDLNTEDGQHQFRRLAAVADIIVDARPRGYMQERGIGYEQLSEHNPGLIYTRISPFGDDGPWADYEACDLVHLALSGIVLHCGYDPHPDGHYDTPPIAPQMWQSYHIAGEMAVMAILGALSARLRIGKGQKVDISIHEAASMNTEQDIASWVFLRQPHRRQTCRHSLPVTEELNEAQISITKDGRYQLPYQTYLHGFTKGWDGPVAVLRKFGAQEDLDGERYASDEVRGKTETLRHVARLVRNLSSRLLFKDDLWIEGQKEGLTWAPLRLPEENTDDLHWWERGTYSKVHVPEVDETLVFSGSKWRSKQVRWCSSAPAPALNAHLDQVFSEWAETSRIERLEYHGARLSKPPVISNRTGKPFALSDVRIIDLGWILASAGASRFLAAMGAEVIKVEHETRLDGMRFGRGAAPAGGRAERDSATAPIPTPRSTSPNRSGVFMEINAGKLGLSLNLKQARAKELLLDLVRDADMIVEGFSPGTMDRMGLGYERLREVNPNIIYVQQSAFGKVGRYGDTRGFGPTAQAISGISEMSGLPAPYPPAGIGYSYLDWFGAYNMANAMLAALYRRDTTGEGCHIDASQVETGLYLTGTSVLDHDVNGRSWRRYGNRSPYKPASPHGIYPVRGEDRWIAIAAFTDAQWQALAEALGQIAWLRDSRFSTLETRMANQDVLDGLIAEVTVGFDGYDLMARLQKVKVPAGICQGAQDRVEDDPQLAHRKWMTEIVQTEIGSWPIKGFPAALSETPAHIGGRYDRGGPNLGEDTHQILRDILGFDQEDIDRLAEDKIV